jgi:hypothetical protein
LVGTLLQYPTRKERGEGNCLVSSQLQRGCCSTPYGGRADCHFNRHELDRRSFSTAAGYRIYFARYVLPKCGQHPLTTVRAIEVEAWLDGLRGATGKPGSGHTIEDPEHHVGAFLPRDSPSVGNREPITGAEDLGLPLTFGRCPDARPASSGCGTGAD